jgi:hypothetical protein
MNWDIDPMFRVIYYPFVSIYQLNCSSFFPIGWSTNWESMNSWCGPRWIIVTCKEIEKITITLITPMFFFLCFLHLWFLVWNTMHTWTCWNDDLSESPFFHMFHPFWGPHHMFFGFFQGKNSMCDIHIYIVVIAYVCSAPKDSLSCCKASTRVFVFRVRGFPTKMVRWVDVSNSFTSTC